METNNIPGEGVSMSHRLVLATLVALALGLGMYRTWLWIGHWMISHSRSIYVHGDGHFIIFGFGMAILTGGISIFVMMLPMRTVLKGGCLAMLCFGGGMLAFRFGSGYIVSPEELFRRTVMMNPIPVSVRDVRSYYSQDAMDHSIVLRFSADRKDIERIVASLPIKPMTASDNQYFQEPVYKENERKLLYDPTKNLFGDAQPPAWWEPQLFRQWKIYGQDGNTNDSFAYNFAYDEATSDAVLIKIKY